MLWDHLRASDFWAMDVSMDSGGLPVFLPVLGFSRWTAPEYRVQHKRVKRGNSPFVRHVVKEAEVSPVNVHRGALFFDADFYRWAKFCATGQSERGVLTGAAVQGKTPRREILVIHFFRGIPFVSGGAGLLSTIGGGLAAAGSLAAATARAGAEGALSIAPALAAAGAFAAIGGGSFAVRAPARAWLLHDCSVSRFKAGSDFDANNPEVSVMELELQPTSFDEFSLSAN